MKRNKVAVMKVLMSSILINKYLLLTRQKANKVSIERGKPLSGGKQVIRGDAAFLLNTRSKVKAIQAHRCWLFPPNSHRTHKRGWEEKPSTQERRCAT